MFQLDLLVHGKAGLIFKPLGSLGWRMGATAVDMWMFARTVPQQACPLGGHGLSCDSQR